MFAGSQTDMCVGLDIHEEMVPMPAPVPVPFPMPFVGEVEYSAVGVLMGMGIGKAMSFFTGSPPTGPVVVNGFQCVKTGDEAKNKETLPHFVIPPGTAWTPLPKPLKLKISPPPPAPDNPAAPPGDAVFITGSKTVLFEQSSACRLGTLAMSCSDPVRLPSSMLLAVPKGLPVLVGGPDAIDWMAAAKAFFLRNKWTAGLLHQLVSLVPSDRLRNLLAKGVCMLTGHPVDVATGRLLTWSEDFLLRGAIPLSFERNYSSAWADRPSTLGHGWSHSFDQRVWTERGRVVYLAPDGRELEFHTHHLQGRVLRDGQELFHPIDRLTLRRLGSGRWAIRSADGLVREFDHVAGTGALVSRITRITDTSENWVRFLYRDGEVDRVESSDGRWVQLEHRDGKLVRLLVQAASGDGSIEKARYVHSDAGDLCAVYDSANHVRTYGYEEHLLVSDIDRDGIAFWFEYDGRDSTSRCVRTWGSDTRTTDRLLFRDITYDVAGRRTFVEDSVGETTVYSYNAAYAITEVRNPHGAIYRFQYDDGLRKIAEVDPIGRVTRYQFDAHGNEIRRELSSGALFQMRYDENDRIVEEIDPYGLVRAWTYDRRSRLTQYANSLGEQCDISYDDRRIRSIVDAKGIRRELVHDARGDLRRVIRADGAVDELSYDQRGRLLSVRDAERRETRFVYDEEDRIVSVVSPGGAARSLTRSPEGDILTRSENLVTTVYEYSGFHKMSASTTAGQRVTWTRDSEDRLIEYRNELDETYRFERDACGEVAAETSFDDRTFRYVRDLCGRPVQRIQPDGQSIAATYEKDKIRFDYADKSWEEFHFDSVGNLRGAANQDVATTMERDTRGRVIAELSADGWTRKKYDSSSDCIELKTSKGLLERIRRGPLGETVEVSAVDTVSQKYWATRIETDLTGLARRRWAPGGVYSETRRDDSGRVVELRTGGDAAQTDTVALEWLATTRLTAKTDSEGRTDYRHDDQGRLAASVTSSSTCWRNPDRRGALYEAADRSDRTYAKGAALIADRAAHYEYDKLGNLAKKTLNDGSAWTYSWTASGQLHSVSVPDGSVVTFKYDALGRRVSMSAGGRETRWMWSGDQLLHEWTAGTGNDSSDLTTWIFDHVDHRPLGKLQGDAAFTVEHDHLGVPSRMFDEAGAEVWAAQLDIYGRTRGPRGRPSQCPWRLPGQYEDEETGLYYNRFRYYDPKRGDYISPDPLLFSGLRSGSNTYSYVRDPLTWIDLLGLLGIIYLRTLVDDASGTPIEYVGQSIDQAARWAAHDRDLEKLKLAGKVDATARYEFKILEDNVPDADLSRLEEDWIRAGGGPGPLANGRYQMNDDRYKNAGGCMPK